MSRAERRAEQKETHKQYFLAAFKELNDRGRDQGLEKWTTLAGIQPAAAQKDDVFMAKRRVRSDIILLLTGHKREDAPLGLNYPPEETPKI